MRYIFLLKKYGMQPYTWKHALAVAIAAVSYLPAILIPNLYNPAYHVLSIVLDIAVRSTAISIIFISLTLLLRISPELNRRWNELMVRLRIK